jgi:hypothetical protein
MHDHKFLHPKRNKDYTETFKKFETLSTNNECKGWWEGLKPELARRPTIHIVLWLPASISNSSYSSRIRRWLDIDNLTAWPPGTFGPSVRSRIWTELKAQKYLEAYQLQVTNPWIKKCIEPCQEIKKLQVSEQHSKWAENTMCLHMLLDRLVRSLCRCSGAAAVDFREDPAAEDF